MKFKPKNREELQDIIKEIIENQEKKTSYRYGLKDIDVSLITDMSNIFSCYNVNKNYEINIKIDWEDPRNSIVDWNVSNVTDMLKMFQYSKFNQLINSWNVSNVINMSNMFAHSSFNQDISNWDVSNVTDMSFMFMNCLFNQDISNWNINNIKSISYIFYNSKFKQDLSNWIFSLNKECSLINFNLMSLHEEKFGIIDGYDDFVKINVTKQFIDNILQNGNDIEKFKMLKILKKYPDIVKDLNIDEKNFNR